MADDLPAYGLYPHLVLPGSFNCSGLVVKALARAEIIVPEDAGNRVHVFRIVQRYEGCLAVPEELRINLEAELPLGDLANRIVNRAVSHRSRQVGDPESITIVVRQFPQLQKPVAVSTPAGPTIISRSKMEKLPVFPLMNREAMAENGSQQTASSANQSLDSARSPGGVGMTACFAEFCGPLVCRAVKTGLREPGFRAMLAVGHTFSLEGNSAVRFRTFVFLSGCRNDLKFIGRSFWSRYIDSNE